jgi:hypothetical protein
VNRLRFIANRIPSLRRLAAQLKAASGRSASLPAEPTPTTLRRATPDEIARSITAPLWVRYVPSYASLLHHYTLETLPQAVERVPEFALAISESHGKLLNNAKRNKYATDLMAMAVGVALLNNGWQVHVRTTKPYLTKDGEQVAPFSTVERSFSKQLSSEEWVARSQKLGIAALPPAEVQKERPPGTSSIA